ncbi:M14 family metallopeptidase [Nonomuraea jiangxiensis]|uniref:Zinc carboxypeptidase n=1 Tax=Nonomuraea jiangxiensis TaxID=633440 RepID=A0A1G9G2D3_9ACTN|nr:M14 metallopeptidase family protein [Nonomuraea jiangxiensis]SDK94862.1 Zinc carboxypeptidase [Nonomuraea jiangxiensis]
MRASLRKLAISIVALVTLVTTAGAVSTPGVSAAAGIPRPDDYFGFRIGSDGNLATWDKMVSYFQLVAGGSDRVTYEKVGDTTLGNPYVMLTISSKKNLDNLNRLVAINARLADPRGLSPAEAERLATEGKPFYYIQAGIHATEVGNSQAMIEIAHRLATDNSPAIKRLLDNVVILLVPSQNPDGLRLVNDYFKATAGTNYNRTYPDLYQKYTGHDDNRDWFMFTQVESRLMVSIQNKYHPQVFQDAHQAGTGAPRMFTPPFLSPSDPNIDPITVQQTNALGMAMQRGMTAAGLKGGQWGTTYDYWSPSRQYQVYHGAVRILTEAASVSNLAYPYTRPTPIGDQQADTNFIEPYDQTTWTLRQILDYTSNTFYTGVQTVASDPSTWLYNFYLVGRRAVTRTSPYAYVIPANQRDPQAVRDALDILHTGAVEIRQASKPFTAGGKDYPAGSYVIQLAQPYGGFAKTLLEVQHYPQLAEYPGGPPQEPYDVTAQTLPLLLGFTADLVKDPFQADTTLLRQIAPAPVTFPAAPAPGGAYAVGPESYGVYQFVSDLQRQGVPTFRAAQEFTDGGRDYPAGTFLIPPTDQARKVLQARSASTGIPVSTVSQVPGVAGVQLKPGTRIGLYKPANNIPSGWLMWMFDQYRVNYQVVTAQDYEGKLSDKYDAIVLPDGVSKSKIVNGLNADAYPAEWSWAHGVGEAGWRQLRDFVEDGGTLVAYGSATGTAQSLLDLPIEPVLPTDDEVFYSPGSLLAQQIDADDPVGWGMTADNPVWFESNQAYRITDQEKYDAKVVGKYPDSGDQLRSGWLIGGEHLDGAANSVAFQVGKGYVVTFGSEAGYRTWNRAEQKMVFNSLYYGPSRRLDADQFARLGG